MTNVQRAFPVLLITVALLIVSAVPRFINLGALTFYGDEETTAMPAYTLATAQDAAMPSGMPYHRALPLTWLNSLSASLLGTDREVAYRLPAAILSILTIPLLFLLLRPLVGTQTAVVAASLLALSEWHLITSREARMYGPFLLCYTGCVLAGWHWLQSRRLSWLFATTLLFLAAISMQVLGLQAIAVILIPLLFGRTNRVGWPIGITLAVALGGLAVYYRINIVNGPPLEWRYLVDQSVPAVSGFGLTYQSWLQQFDTRELAVLLIGSGAGLWLARSVVRAGSSDSTLLWNAVTVVLCVGVGAFTAAGQLHGAALAALIVMLLHPLDARALARKAAFPLICLGLGAAAWVAVAVFRLGVAEGLQSLAMYPFPYLAYFFEMFPVISVLFCVTTIGVAVTAYDPGAPQGLRYCVLAALVPLIAVGLLLDWGGVRYVFAAHPFFLAVAAAGLLTILRLVLQIVSLPVKASASVIAIALVALGIDPGHGLITAERVLNVDYGESLDELALGFPLYPDHGTPGRFVRDRAKADDIIVAEDALQQYWYTGRVDLWLRDPIRTAQFLYLDEDGRRRDVYVNSVALTPQVLDELMSVRSRCIWIITSAETQHRRDDYLNDQQHEWLTDVVIKTGPVFTGRDGSSRVYLLNCATPDGPK